MSGRTLAVALVAIVCLTLVLPPLAARHVNARRIARAQEDVRTILETLLANRGAVFDAARKYVGAQPAVFTGPGATPEFETSIEWPEGRTHAPVAMLPGMSSALIAHPDPWGNHYLVAIGGGTAEQVNVLSAGPNGIVETRWVNASKPAGDDIGIGQ